MRIIFHHPARSQICPLSLHDALPISARAPGRAARPAAAPRRRPPRPRARAPSAASATRTAAGRRSEEHTSELQSHSDLVCHLLLEKKELSDGAAELAADLTLLNVEID